MIPDEVGRQLHDRRTRGETLSHGERLELDRWYGDQDEAGDRELSAVDSASPTDALADEIEAVTSQLAIVTRDIQQTARESAALRRETDGLRQQLPR